MAQPTAILEKLFHWTAVHPEIRFPVSSYYLQPERVLLDPLLPSPRGLAWLRQHGPPEHIVLTNRLHSRASRRIVEELGCTVWCPRAGLDHLHPELQARPYDPGDELPGGIRAVAIGAICPDESALLLPRHRAAAVADGVIRDGDGPLSFVPDDLLVDDPGDADRVKRGLREAYRRLTEHDWDHLLLAHGNPWPNDGRAALRAWVHAGNQ